MSRARAIEINSAMVTLFMASEFAKEHTQGIGSAAELLADLDLVDLVEADRIVRGMRGEIQPDGSRTAYMTMSDRGIAAIYTLLNYKVEPEDESIMHLPVNQFWLGDGRAFLILAFRSNEQIEEATRDVGDKDE